MKIFIPYGRNGLLNTFGPCGAFKTLEQAEAAAKENCDEWKIAEYEIE